MLSIAQQIRAEDLADRHGRPGRRPTDAASESGVRIYWRNVELVSGRNPYQWSKRTSTGESLPWDIKSVYRLRHGTVGRPHCGNRRILEIEREFPGTARWLRLPLTEMLALWARDYWQFGSGLTRVTRLLNDRLQDYGWQLNPVLRMVSSERGLRSLLAQAGEPYLKALIFAAHLAARFAPAWEGASVPLVAVLSDELDVEPFGAELGRLIELIESRLFDVDAVEMAKAVYKELLHRRRMMTPGPVISSDGILRRRLKVVRF